MPAQSLSCPECNAPLEPPPGRTQFFCNFCGSTVVVPPEYLNTAPRVESDDDEDNILRPAPDLSKFTIDKRGDDLTISWSWWSWVILFLIPFTLFWDGIVIGMGVAVFTTAPWYFALLYFLVPHVWIGLFLIYLILAMMLNRTTVHVDRHLLRIAHGPVPWKAPKPIHTDSLQQLFVKSKVKSSKNGSSMSYSLEALLDDGSSHTLIKNQQDENIPIALERMIEVHLDIKDQRVKGEH